MHPSHLHRSVAWLSILLLVFPLGLHAEGFQRNGLEMTTLTASLSAPANLRQANEESGCPSSSQQLHLTPAGYGGGGRFTSIAYEPTSLGNVFVGSDVAGVFRSHDGGDNFQFAGLGLEGFAVADLASNPMNSQQVILLTDDGLYVSEDHGESWQKRTGRIRYNARVAGSHLITFAKDNTWVATDQDGVFRVSLAVPHLEIEHLAGLELTQVTSLVYHEGFLYAGTMQGAYRFSNGQWTPFNQGLPADHLQVVDMISDAHNRLHLVEKTSGLHVLDQSDSRWKALGRPLQEPNTFKALAVSPRSPDVLLLASHPESWPHRLYKSNNGGVSWKSVESFELDPESARNWAASLNSVEEIAFDPVQPGRVLLTDWWNVWQSDDEGENWVQLHRGLQNTVINDVKVHPSLTGTLFLCAADNGLMVSRDGGRTWARQMTGVLDGHAQEIEIASSNPSKMYLLAQPWGRKDRVFVYKSLDAGATWKDVSFAVPSSILPPLGYVDGLPTNLEVDPVSDETVYVGTNGYGVFKTSDGGKTWRHSSAGITTPYIKGPQALLIRPGDPRTLYASTQGGGVFRSTDGAETWKSISSDFPFTFGLAIDVNNPNRILAARPEKRVLISEDGGSEWREVLLPGVSSLHIASHAISISPSDPKRVAIGTLGYDFKEADGIFISGDGGYTYEPVASEALPKVSVNTLTWTFNPEHPLLIGFNGTGLSRGHCP